MIVQVPDTDESYKKYNDFSGEPAAYEEIGHSGAVELEENARLGAYTGAMLKMPNQGKFHPTK